MGISPSEFFVRAAERYLKTLESDVCVKAINAAFDDVDDSNAVAARYGRHRLARAGGW